MRVDVCISGGEWLRGGEKGETGSGYFEVGMEEGKRGDETGLRLIKGKLISWK